MEIIDFIRQFPVKSFKKGDILLSEGDPTDTLFALRTGFIKVTSLNENGAERLLWIAGRYDIAPTEQFFSTRGLVQFFYTALSDGDMYEIDKVQLLSHAKVTPPFMTEIATSMSIHYDDLLKRIDSIEQISVREKLIHTLRYVAERFSADDVVDIYAMDLKLTHNDFAQMIGSTRETTSLELSKLRDEGVIAYDRTKFVMYVSKLMELKTIA